MIKIANVKILLAIIAFCSTISAMEPEIRYIRPPQLGDDNLGKKILCHRPMRAGSPRMEVEIIGNKTIVHNYGHGGSGWTLGPGAAKYVVKLLIKQESDKNKHIAIVGAGVLGLFSAWELLNAGFNNITIYAKEFDNLTSHNAGGLVAAISMSNEISVQKLIDKIGINAYKFYAQIALNMHPHFTKGTKIMPTYFASRESSGLEPYVGKVMAEAKDVILDFGNGTTQKMVAYDDGIFIDTGSIMIQLKNLVQEKAHMVKKTISNFDELNEDIIVNCSGLGASELSSDNSMVSVQGHLIMLKDQNPADIDHMILAYFGEGQTEDGCKIKRSFYMFPKALPASAENDVGVIGGTFIEGATQETPHEDEFQNILVQARKFYGLD